MITDEDRERVRAATDLVELVQETVELKPRGHEFWGCCPFHGEKTPSFHIIPATQIWHCFGCGEGGDIFSYIMRRENLGFVEAIHYLAERAGIELHEVGNQQPRGTKRSRLIAVCEATQAFYHTMLMRGKDGAGRQYCAERGLGADICKRYHLGYAPGHSALVSHLTSLGFSAREMIDANVALARGGRRLVDRFYERVMFPIFDEQSHCIAFGGRITGAGEPKYLNTAETTLFHKKKNLYGFNWAKEGIVAKNEVIVVEGYTDAIACWEAGIHHVVATLGTALTEHHVKTLNRFAKRIVYLFDGDAAGQAAAERALHVIELGDMDLRCVILPDNLDPFDFLQTHDAAELEKRIETAEPLIDFVLRKLGERSDTTTPGGRANALEEALRLIYPLRESYLIDSYYVQIADFIGVDSTLVREAAPRVFREVNKERSRAKEREQRAQYTSQTRAQSMPQAQMNSQQATGIANSEAGQVRDAHQNSQETQAQAYTEAVAQPLMLSDLERRSLQCERELLSLMTAFPDSFRSFAHRISDLTWIDTRSEAIAWAVLATPEGSSVADVMQAVRLVCPQVVELAGTGTLGTTSAHPTDTTIAFLLDTLEMYTVKRHLKSIQAQLRSNQVASVDERRTLTIQATQEARRLRELEQSVEGVANPFRVNLDTSHSSA
ncbi:DNA primase [Collinsella sp. zg1085]|uniref:DNA primase n=1 Tax=Collinsella sp. zg1085 TaxID=2844380 RepID=UPI001C0A9C58|nr:DNA primase [Collinsella sp. zg1085]QWT16963.1 DNA primase [Collinsella sp. zg1085]